MTKRGLMPKTRLEDIIEFYKEVKSNENLAFARIKAGIFDKNSALSFLKEKRYDSQKKYSNILCLDDRHEFSSLRMLRKFLQQNGFDDKRINDSLKHERAHYLEALAQGFYAQGFLCWLVNDSGKKDYVCSTRISCYTMPSHDAYKKASKAPKNLSIIDTIAQ
ncbi:MAG: hypothetical protein V1660_03325 [archaeon]